MKQLHLPLLFILLATLSSMSFAQDTTKSIIDRGEERLSDNQKAQRNADKLHGETRDLVEDYQSLLKVVDGLKVYNKILRKQLDHQEQEMTSLDLSIANTAIIERQILPLLTRMLDGLDGFVTLDIPFLLSEREKRVDDLRRLILRSELTNAEKTRRVFEAFQIENEYGNSMESYKGKLNLGEKTFDVDYLRVGRISFTYRTVGSGEYGYWDTKSNSWKPLEDTNFRRNIDKGIKMTRQELAPELFTIPVTNTLASSKGGA